MKATKKTLEQSLEDLRDSAKACGFDPGEPPRPNAPQTKEVLTCGFDVNRRFCGMFRDLLESLRFYGLNVSWHESGGFSSHGFTVKAPVDEVREQLGEIAIKMLVQTAAQKGF